MINIPEVASRLGSHSCLGSQALSQGQRLLRFTSSPQGPLQWPTARDQDVLSRPSDLLLYPLNKALLCSERGHCILLSILKILECRKLGDVESFCQGLVDGGINSCKDTRALGRGRGQPCTTASDAVLAEEEPRRQPPTHQGPAETSQGGNFIHPGNNWTRACPSFSFVG